MKAKTIIIASAAALGAGVAANSCMAVATSGVDIAIIKQVLLGGIGRGLAVVRDKDAFMQSDLIDQALPSQLRSINNMLKTVAPGLVQKEKEYIAEAAAYTANLSEPILKNAVNSLNADDVARIMRGEPGTATEILKEKSASQLVAAITPKVDEKLNQYGLVRTMNSALQGSSMLGSLFGNSSGADASANISRLASEQIVEGIFKLIANYERQNYSQISNAAGNK